MPRSSRRRKTRPRVVVPITSMGDIAFQLIIFFILASTFAKEPSAELDPATAASLEQLATAKVLVTIDENDRIFFNKDTVPNADALEDLINAELAEVEPEDRTVQLRAHRESLSPTFEPVIEAISKTGAKLSVVGEQSAMQR